MKKFMNGLSHPWVVGLATLCTIIAVIWSVFIWFIPSPTLLSKSAATLTPSTTQSIISTPTSPLASPTPTPSPTPVPTVLTWNKHLICAGTCSEDITINTVTIDTANNQTIMNLTVKNTGTSQPGGEGDYFTQISFKSPDGVSHDVTGGTAKPFSGFILGPQNSITLQGNFDSFVPTKGVLYTLSVSYFNSYFYDNFQDEQYTF